MRESISYFKLSTKPLKCGLCSREQKWKLQINNLIISENTTERSRQGSQEKTVSFTDLLLMLEETYELLHLFVQITAVIIWEFLKTVNTDYYGTFATDSEPE